MLQFGSLIDAWSREAPEEHIVLPVYDDDRLGGRAVLRYGVGRPGVRIDEKGRAWRAPLVHYARVLLYNTMEEAALLAAALNRAVAEGARVDEAAIERAVTWMIGSVARTATARVNPVPKESAA